MRFLNHFAFFLLSVFLTLTIARAEVKLEGLEAKVDAFVEKHRPHPDSGIAVGVVKDGELVFFKGYGLRDREKREPVTEDTFFAIGSCTKGFTSLALAMLADEGKLSLDQPVRTVLADFAVSDLSVSERATFVDLLSHRVGLPRHDLLWYATPFSADELYERLPYLGMNRNAGKGFRESTQYNNLLYMVLGRAVARASGQGWEDFTRERIFAKLGMEGAQFSVKDGERPERFAKPYGAAKALAYKDLTSVGPAGSINATMRDMVKWIAFWQRGGATEKGEKLISEESRAKIFRTESYVDAPSWGIRMSYGLGWFLDEVEGKKIASHAGNIDGFSAHVSFAPGENIGLVVLTNENGNVPFQMPWKITQNGAEQKLLPYVVYEHLLQRGQRGLGLEQDPSLAGPLNELLNPLALLPISQLSEPAYFYAFTAPLVTEQEFHDLGYGRIVLREESGQYQLRYYNLTLPLTPSASPDIFYYGNPDNASQRMEVRFERAGGEILSVRAPLEPEVEPIHFVRTR